MKDDFKILAILSLISAIIIGVVAVLSASSQKTVNSSIKDVLIRADSNKMEVKNAKVTLVEFGDYQCPACKAAQPTVEKIRQDYKGKITFVFRNFPLPQHQNALVSSEAAEAAGEQGKYWEMNSLLYSHQDEWSNLTNPIDKFVGYAKSLGLDTDKFRKSIEEKKFEQKITGDKTDGETAGVNSTPTFFLNNEKLVGGQNYSFLKEKIDSLLKE
jgi:protein-disulfide isomerase